MTENAHVSYCRHFTSVVSRLCVVYWGYVETILYIQNPGFQVRGGALKFFFSVFRVKNHDFTPKNHIFSNCEGGAKIFGVFRVKNHDFTPKNHIFSNFRGAGGAGYTPRLDPPLEPSLHKWMSHGLLGQTFHIDCIRINLKLIRILKIKNCHKLFFHLRSLSVLSGVPVTWSLVLCVCLADRCLFFCIVLFWPLSCLFFFDIRILITPLVSSSSSFKWRVQYIAAIHLWNQKNNSFNREQLDFKILWMTLSFSHIS